MTTRDTPEARIPRYAGRGATGDAEKDDLRATRLDLLDIIAGHEAEIAQAVAAERARITAAVRGLHGLTGNQRAALAIVELP
jgi:hypothetical protein